MKSQKIKSQLHVFKHFAIVKIARFQTLRDGQDCTFSNSSRKKRPGFWPGRSHRIAYFLGTIGNVAEISPLYSPRPVTVTVPVPIFLLSE